MKIITVSREFGSGGREIAKRLSDVLGIAYYDSEIITEIAKKADLDENYVAHSLEKGIQPTFQIHFACAFSHISAPDPTAEPQIFCLKNTIRSVSLFMPICSQKSQDAASEQVTAASSRTKK